MTWFARIANGTGAPGFSAQNDLLRSSGYYGRELWLTLDGAYFPHDNVGVGGWAALSYGWATPAGQAPTLHELTWFVGGELPVKIGTRTVSLVLSPRLGLAVGRLELGGEAPFQAAPAFGGEISVTSFKHHFGLAFGLLRASAPPTGELGRSYDFGGFYVLFGGSIDG